jgi:hypothetical protein
VSPSPLSLSSQVTDKYGEMKANIYLEEEKVNTFHLLPRDFSL